MPGMPTKKPSTPQQQSKPPSATTPYPMPNPNEQSIGKLAAHLIGLGFKGYAILVLQFGTSIAETILGILLPGEISQKIIKGEPLDLDKMTKILQTGIKILGNDALRKELFNVADEITNTLTPPLQLVFTKFVDILAGFAEQAGSKMFSAAMTAASDVPPVGLVLGVISLLTVGVNALTSFFQVLQISGDSAVSLSKEINQNIAPKVAKVSKLFEMPASLPTSSIPASLTPSMPASLTPSLPSMPASLTPSLPSFPASLPTSLPSFPASMPSFLKQKGGQEDQEGGLVEIKKLIKYRNNLSSKITRTLNRFQNTNRIVKTKRARKHKSR
jgi:hypothetical protein